ncbi:MAG: hypothetical protein IIA77_04990 [Proteobacteria bacterium]|nr:hypothetical protein [Pseudomonadota bacterium]
MNTDNIRLDKYDAVAQARKTYIEVQIRLNDLEKQVSDINQRAIDGKENTTNAVDRYLIGRDYEHRDVEQERASSLERINAERRIAHRALQKQKRIVTEAEIEAAKLICKLVRPEYEEIPARMSKALIAVQEISAEEENFRVLLSIEAINFSNYIDSCAFRPALGNDTRNGHYSIIGFWHIAQIQNGYLKPSDIEKPWRKIWALDSVQVDGQSKGNGEDRPETIVKQNENGWLNFN